MGTLLGVHPITEPKGLHGTGIFTCRHFPLFMWPFLTVHVGKYSLHSAHLRKIYKDALSVCFFAANFNE